MLTLLLAALAALVVLLFLAGRIGLLHGAAPTDLGVHAGRLKAPSSTPNSVSSQAGLWPDNPQHLAAAIAPLPISGDGVLTLARLRGLAAAMPGAQVVESRDDYVRVEFTTRWLRFTDDAEFWLDRAQGVIQVRSASRIGKGDFGVNRARIESLRAGLSRP